MAAGGNSLCHALELVSVYIATPFLNLTHAQKVIRLFVHSPTVNSQAKRPVKKNGCKSRKIRIISVVLKMSGEFSSGETKIPDIQKSPIRSGYPETVTRDLNRARD